MIHSSNWCQKRGRNIIASKLIDQNWSRDRDERPAHQPSCSFYRKYTKRLYKHIFYVINIDKQLRYRYYISFILRSFGAMSQSFSWTATPCVSRMKIAQHFTTIDHTHFLPVTQNKGKGWCRSWISSLRCVTCKTWRRRDWCWWKCSNWLPFWHFIWHDNDENDGHENDSNDVFNDDEENGEQLRRGKEKRGYQIQGNQ